MYQRMFEYHAELLKALAHPRRLEIVQVLRDQEVTVGELQRMLGLPQANLSQHLMVLREAKVVSFRKNGKEVYYKLRHRNFAKASDLIREVLAERYGEDKEMKKELQLKMKQLLPVVKDPVCEMRVSPKTAYYAHLHQGIKYYFCAAGCYKEFKKQPQKYARVER